ncbi:hypothetical protein [Streptomyces sp. NBC_00670]|jgi:hypothetical protein|uniref:hypothetical protein n=1 Tax=Streptomyces sp. NBC_00670 TaxID=2975804 RepID=UPI002E2F5215|nr:hypothetical protein [Streptomyces sp. NBC_00670]
MAKTTTSKPNDQEPEAVQEDAPTPGDQDAADASQSAPEQLPPGVYEYVHGTDCVYPHVPLTCHAHQPVVPETQDSPGVPERAATVFEWRGGPPADGRWAKTRKKPNQAADNAGGLLSSKE